ncbi:MAG: C-terminal helicase domain-containing protein [Saprospiraceae bacterium]
MQKEPVPLGFRPVGSSRQNARRHYRVFQPGIFTTVNCRYTNEIVQKESISYILPDLEPELGKLAGQKRMFFLPVRSSETALSVQKTSIEEADLCTRIVLFYKELWKKNGKSWDPEKTLGIITPWRAQIAQISDALAASGLKPNDITIDTVERYQGGARDIILVSTCVHSEWQLSSLVNVSSEGIDRKLNVALTRARQQLIMMGNPDVLKQDERYRLFIEQYGVDGWS